MKTIKKQKSNPLISIVIPAYNEEKVIGDCIKTLLNQTYENIEIIIVDDGSKDKTKDIVKRFSSVKLINGLHKGPGISRNLGASKAKGDILVFVDADMTFDKDYIKFLTLPVRKGECIGTEERFQKSSNLHNIWSRCWGQYVKEDRFGKDKKGIVFRSIIKEEFLKMGGFDPKYGYADDQTFLIKFGAKPDIADKAICYHKNPESLKEVFHQSKWIGASLFVHHPILSKKHLFIPILVGGILGIIPASFYLFLKKIVKKRFSPKNPIDVGYLAIFSFTRVLGILIGVLKNNLFGINYR
ncbi:hypothetical protein COU60_00870 [Candidatus Pacearchaeota archaeon CG10_big_fil_rev_8_21_14_0_10_34_76]|nr:MAG: hypothetical protein COU60_00870 [Candidatus Pacearchaeota archaeon CG10_big_fil_rev_8_21_14_0_10_34_76]